MNTWHIDTSVQLRLAEMKREDIQSLLYQLIDVVVQCGVEKQRRFVKEIWYGGVDREPGARH